MPFPSAPPPLPGVTHTDVRVERTRWHVATAGDGPPLVLLHGWPHNWWTWRHLIGDLARTHRVYAPDLRGFGWSEAPPGRYSKMGLAVDVERLLDELGIESCTLVGHDWGGFVAFLTALRAPERVERLAAFSIIHPWPAIDRPDPLALLRTAYQLPLATPRLGPALVRHVPSALRLLLQRGSAPGFHWDPQDADVYVQQWRRPEHARATSALYRTFLRRELPALLRGRYGNRRLEVPTLLATGEHDPIITPDRLAGHEAHASNLRTEVIPGAGHFVADERPDAVLGLVRHHLES